MDPGTACVSVALGHVCCGICLRADASLLHRDVLSFIQHELSLLQQVLPPLDCIGLYRCVLCFVGLGGLQLNLGVLKNNRNGKNERFN